MTAELRRLLGTWAVSAAAHAESLARIAPAWGSRTAPLAGGHLVLAEAGMYVNRALAAGIDVELTDADLATVIDLSAGVGVQPAVEVTTLTRPATIARLRAAELEIDPDADVVASVRSPHAADVAAPVDVDVRAVTTEGDLRSWQDVAAAGWGHQTVEARRASDAYAAAAFAVEGEVLLIAVDAADRRPLGCASLTIRDGIATLGGMATLPSDRRRGVQAAMIRHRLGIAADRGCDLAATTTLAGGTSERNVRRHGFTPLCTIRTMVRRSGGTTS